MSKPEVLNILVDDDYESTSASLSPTISWQYYDSSGDIQDSYYLKVGTCPGGSDIVDTGWVVSSSSEYTIPSVGYSAVLKSGLRYYVSVQVQNSSELSVEKESFFITDGDYWANNVDNSVGWTVEFYYKNDSTSIEGKDFSDTWPHHTIEMNDGTYSMSVELYTDRIRIITSEISTYLVDNTKLNLIRMTAKDEDVNLYINGVIALEIVGKNTVVTSTKEIKFAGTGSSYPVSSLWSSIFLNLDGVRDVDEIPDSLNMSSVLFNDEDIVDIIQDMSAMDQVFVATNPEDVSKSGKIYRVHKNFTKKSYRTEPVLQETINKVIVDVNSDKWLSTKDAVYRISGEKNRDVDFDVNLDDEGNLAGFQRIENCSGVCATFNKLMRIDTSVDNDDAFWYYRSVGNDNSLWFENVDNSTGWMIEADVRVIENNSPNYSVGIVVNDGAHEETIYLHKNKIELKTAGIFAYCDLFSQSKSVRIVGKGEDIYVYLKTDDEWSRLIDGIGKFVGTGQVYSNSGKPSHSVTTYHEERAVWHSKKDSGNWQVFINTGGNDNWSHEKQLTFDDADNFNPDIAIDSGGISHIVYQTNKFGSWEIVYLKYNGYQAVGRTRITNAVGNSTEPKITAMDNGDLKVVWLDDRDGSTEVYGATYSADENAWRSSAFDYDDVKISSAGGSSKAKNLSLHSNGNVAAVCWNDDRNTVESVFMSYGSSSWVDDIQVTGFLNPASHPDLAVDSSDKVHICWVDSRLGTDQIYYNTIDSGVIGTEESVYLGSNDAEEPSISASGDEAHLCWVSDDSGRKIFYRRTVDGSLSAFTGVLENDDYSVLDCQIFALPTSRDIRFLYRGVGADGYTSVLGQKDHIPDTDIDISGDITSSSVRVSNLDNTKAILFGDITQNSTSISEWAGIRYSATADVHPAIVDKWSFNNIADFTVDDEVNLFVIDNGGLSIYNSIVGNSLLSNDASSNAALSAPANLIQIVVAKNNYIIAHDGVRIFYHLPLSSKLTDSDMEWFEVDTSAISGRIKYVDKDPGKLLWIGTSEGAVSVNFDQMIAQNIIDQSSMTVYASGYDVNSITFGIEYIWVSVEGGIIKVSRYNNSESIVTIEDGIIDHSVMKTLPYGSTQWAFGANGLVRISGSNVAIYRGLISTDKINDIFVDSDGAVWVAGDAGLEYLDVANSVNYVFDKQDGVGVVSADNAYKNYAVITQDALDRRHHHLVKVNGVFRDPTGYFFDSTNGVIIFDFALSSNSIVELVYYRFVEKAIDFGDPTVLLEIASTSPRRISSLEQGDYSNQIVVSMVIDGDSYVYKLNFGGGVLGVSYPFGTIIYDKTPPLGTVDISDQISANQVVLAVNAEDEVSGVKEMIVSKFANFTSDGSTPLPSVPYTDRVVFDLGSNIGSGVSNHEFTSASGSVMHTFTRTVGGSSVSELFVGTSLSASILKFNVATRSWTNVENLNADYVHAMTTHLGKMYVGTGSSGKLFVTTDGENYTLVTELIDPDIRSLLSATDDKLYIGTGSSGKVYTYDGISVSLLFDLDETSILDMVEISGYVYMATGNKGRIYRYNIASGSIEIVFDDSDSQILSINVGKDFNSNSDTVYAGTYSNGKILRHVASRDLFVKSFESVLNACRSIKSFTNSEQDDVVDVYACVDERMLKLGPVSWNVIYIDVDSEDIQDMEVFNGEIFVMTSSNIKTVSTGLDKYVYIKFIDFAGNETVLYAADGTLKPRTGTERLFDILTAEDQAGFSLQNRILIVDDSGSVTKTFVGSRPFFSADQIDVEVAVYDSEVFNGTNNLVAWDKISYSATTPTNTAVEISIRSADIESDVANQDWSDPVESGRDISGISGKYLQFRATLKSSIRGVTPVLDNVTVTSKTTFAVHYFTTNFVLSSNLKSGILTANTVTPVGTELVFGISSNTSTNWGDYQIIEPNKLFVMEESNKGPNLKVGVKFLSTTSDVAEMHEFGLIFCTEDGNLVKLNLQS